MEGKHLIKRGKKVIKYIGKSIILQEYSSERKRKERREGRKGQREGGTEGGERKEWRNLQ